MEPRSSVSESSPEWRSVARPSIRMSSLRIPPPPMIRKQQPTIIQKQQEQKTTNPSWESFRQVKPQRLPSVCVGRLINCSGMTLQQVLTRISNYVQRMSIHCEFHQEEGRIDCRTDCFLEFSIFLWDSAEEIVVEIQRCKGCGIGFQRIRRGLIGAIHQTQESLKSQSSLKETVVPPKVCALIQRLRDSSELNQAEEETKEALSTCCRLLDASRPNSNVLGLEYLMQLTGPQSNNSHEMVARTLIGCDSRKSSDHLRQFLLSTLERTHSHAVGICDEEIRKLTLKTVSNLLLTIANMEKPSHSLEISSDFLRAIDKALQFKQNATTCPLEAKQSAQCLGLIQTISSTTTFNVH